MTDEPAHRDDDGDDDRDHDAYSCARAWVALSTAHALVTDRLSAALTESCGLSMNDFEVLLRLNRVAPPGLRLGDLQPAVRLSQPSLSRMIARLAYRGLVRRERDPDDGRSVLISITEAGAAQLRRAAPVHADTLREVLLDRLTPAEHDSLAAVLDRVAGISPVGPPETRSDQI
ncbi:DNA-binding transcriptional regulator, MarR family [Sinosporangium album]|uniref:DNA-binding transcriptional regulator, MarR family n=1 Tax=Sinosporangium album TaxID=504805 RepID=A0A1G7U6X5_9ACTN|nr:MarR family transcriptional regulator [Sinosporangium album]SDG43326.1 DNA-binding transcriptional regulator, MarR family [Sinosporangium album]